MGGRCLQASAPLAQGRLPVRLRPRPPWQSASCQTISLLTSPLADSRKRPPAGKPCPAVIWDGTSDGRGPGSSPGMSLVRIQPVPQRGLSFLILIRRLDRKEIRGANLHLAIQMQRPLGAHPSPAAQKGGIAFQHFGRKEDANCTLMQGN